MKIWELEDDKFYKCENKSVSLGCKDARTADGAYWVEQLGSVSLKEVTRYIFTEVKEKNKITLYRHWYLDCYKRLMKIESTMPWGETADEEGLFNTHFIKSTILEEFEYEN